MTLEETLRSGLLDTPDGPRPAGIEIRQDLAPSEGQTVMPPSYEGKLEIHPRHIDGTVRNVVELDSVGSSANRIEETLHDEYRAGRYPLPVSKVTIEASGSTEPVEITTLQAPHRLFDGWIRLATERGADVAFERTQRGQELSLVHPDALDALVEASAHDLVFGVWDSHRTGPAGQVRIPRSFTSSVLGLDPLEVRTVAARTDPVNLGEAKDIKVPKGQKLSEQGLSSIPPQRRRPGVSITEARFVGFLSFAALRRLRFARYDATAVRTALAAVVLHGMALRADRGWFLRSECDLLPTSDLSVTVVGPRGDHEPVALDAAQTAELLSRSAETAAIADRGLDLVGGSFLTGLVEKAVEADLAKGAGA